MRLIVNQALHIPQIVCQVTERGGNVIRCNLASLITQHIEVHDSGDSDSPVQSAVDFGLDVTTLSAGALLFTVCHKG